MSGIITPLIDTLLHEVLGKRADAPSRRELNAPVQPMDPAVAPRALHGDSRLDGRQPPLPVSDTARDRASADSLRQPAGQTAPPASTHTHFSAAARTIADALSQYPAPPSAIRPAAPLLPTAAPSVAPAQLAAALQGSIQHSGVFYEAHVARWFHGDLPRQALEREPQMQQAQSSAQRPPPEAGTLAPRASDDTPAAPRALPAPDSLDDTLQGLVRHQLEMLVTPVLRWEGDVWSGVFMALAIQLPAGLEERHHADDEPAGQDDRDAPWQSELTLSLPTLGELQVALTLQDQHVTLSLASASDDTLARLQHGLPALREQLEARGFEAVRLTLRSLSEGSA